MWRRSCLQPAMGEIVSAFPPIPGIDLVNKGGNNSDLSFANFYVGNSGSWDQNDIKSIDSALAQAMSDKNLNNVMVQYFPGHDTITSTFKGSQEYCLADIQKSSLKTMSKA